MCKHSCLDCEFYVPEEEIFNGYEKAFKGIKVMRTKTVEQHCTENPKAFKKWWKANKFKTREEVDDVPSCFTLKTHHKMLEDAKRMSEDFLKEFGKKLD